jgi:hypothetical protein
MQVSIVSVAKPWAKPWAYCNEPFRNMEQGVEAHSPDTQFGNGEFCAAATREKTSELKRVL